MNTKGNKITSSSALATIQEKLEEVNNINTRGAFRRFKDKLYDLNLEKHWYQYRDEAYEKIARQWCERHKIDIVE